MKKKSKVRPIAFVLPQFHPIPENDEWWGKGFTEWTNVTKAKPLFDGHYQPHLPTDLGFYDLRLPQARKAQADLALKYGIQGFCYYHYWFNGKRLLEQPIDGMLGQKNLKMPFMLCWANENWTRRWDGRDQDVLIKQEYSLKDDEEHMRWLCKNIFSDERYIKVNGSPVFIIYRTDLFPDISRTSELWRKIAVEEYGYNGLYLCSTESFHNEIDPKSINFDATIEFSPHRVMKHIVEPTKGDRLRYFFKIKKMPSFSQRDFRLGVQEIIQRELPDYKVFRSVTPNWDNTARKGENAFVGINSSPELYFEWLSKVIQKFNPYSKDENFVFINAMNEWAEGNHLEPCTKHGTSYLEATKRAIDNIE